MTKVDIGLLAITALVVVAIGTLLGFSKELSVLPEALIALVGILIGKQTGPLVAAMKAKRAKK